MNAIGNVRLVNQVIAAPMAGISDQAYRILAKEAGCALVCTEMISDQALLYGNPKTLLLLNHVGEAGPLSVQIFGSNPGNMARAAKIAEDAGADLIDLNMGCPVPKVVRNGAGAALMRNPELAARIVREVVSSVNVPVTVKMRKGWDENSVNAVEVALLAEAAGAAAVTVHGRLKSQYYTGRADWGIIKSVKDALTIPVIGNGDIQKPADARMMLDETGCDAVMIGRAALGNPWIFSRTIHYLATDELLPYPPFYEKLNTALRHLELISQTKGDKIALLEMRKHAAWYIKGLPGAALMRQKINGAESVKELALLLTQDLVKVNNY
ncbi:MAG TPA: tRNA dihydrouridine synthase DusB [Desulfotomaculum sp.]|nr:tRNA dihydrouridine synthase DusB [Desulfotomaculum sp.]